MNRCVLAIFGLLCLCLCTPLQAQQDRVFHHAVKLSKPKAFTKMASLPLDSIPLNLWLPANVPVLRGLLINPYVPDFVKPASFELTARTGRFQIASHWGFGVLYANMYGIRKEDISALRRGLEHFAKVTGHPELSTIPFCIQSVGAGSPLVLALANQYPTRTIACVVIGKDLGPNSNALRKIPILTISAEHDSASLVKIWTKLQQQRKKGALWTVAPLWGKQREYRNPNNLARPFLDQVIAFRVPQTKGSGAGTVVLRDYPPNEGWLGSFDPWEDNWAIIAPSTQAKSNPKLVCWLPNEFLASTWRAFVAKQPSLNIGSSIVSLTRANHQVTLVIDGTLPDGIERLEYYNGSIFLGESRKYPYELVTENLTAGVAALYVVNVYRSGLRETTRPYAVLIRPDGKTTRLD